MDLSIFFSKWLGIYILILASIWLLRKEPFERAVKEMVLSDGLFAFTGAFAILFGLLIVIAHPIWQPNWKGLITVLGYLSILKGLLRLVFPDESKRLIILTLDRAYGLSLIFLFILGAFLTYNGFTKV